MWEVKDQKPVHAFDGHQHLYHLSLLVRTATTSSVDEGGTVKLWDLRKLKELKSFQVAGAGASVSFLDASGKYLVVATASSVVVREVKPWSDLVSVETSSIGACFLTDAQGVISVDGAAGWYRSARPASGRFIGQTVVEASRDDATRYVAPGKRIRSS